jgi:HEPN domain-containing protein
MNPDNEKDEIGSSAQWITHAESDLRLGRLGADDHSVLREQVCFHAQQAAEKALKAVLVSWRIDFPYTHDIKGLLRIAETSGIVIPPTIQQAALLTPYAVETRYPGDWMDITESEMQEALDTAEHMVLWAKSIIRSGGDKT